MAKDGSKIYLSESREPSPDLLSRLSQLLPFTIPILRRLQFMDIKGGKTEFSRVLWCAANEPGSTNTEEFAVAYLDFSRGPETEMWLYSSIEQGRQSEARNRQAETQVTELLRRIREIEQSYARKSARDTPGIVLVGSLHERVFNMLRGQGRIAQATVPHFKFIFNVEDLPHMTPLPDKSLQWRHINKGDIPLVLSRTSIPRRERTMVLLPSVAIATKKDDPIAWAFLGPDGSLTSLHCEEEYRGRGLAKAVAQKLFRERTEDFGPEKLCHADVAEENIQSQGVCRSLNGVASWTIYWAWIDIKASF